MKLLPFKAVENLILEGGFGTYRLFTLQSNELIAGSHLVTAEKDAAQALAPAEVVAHLTRTLDLIGDGDFRIVLKKNNMSNSNAEVTHRFSVRADNSSGQSQPAYNGYGGLGADQIEKIVQERLLSALTAEREKQAVHDRVKELETQIKQMNAARFKKKPTHWLKELGQLGKMGAAVLISERWPKAVPLVEKVIAKFDGEEEEEEEEEETGFTRPSETD